MIGTAEQARIQPTIRAAERKLATIDSADTIVLSTEAFDRLMRHGLGLVKALLDAAIVKPQ